MSWDRDRAGPRDVVAGGGGGGGGGGTKSRSLEPSDESREGGMRGGYPLSLGGFGGPPQEIFSKSMFLRTHSKPF